jgi:hypothetical protein
MIMLKGGQKRCESFMFIRISMEASDIAAPPLRTALAVPEVSAVRMTAILPPVRAMPLPPLDRTRSARMLTRLASLQRVRLPLDSGDSGPKLRSVVLGGGQDSRELRNALGD